MNEFLVCTWKSSNKSSLSCSMRSSKENFAVALKLRKTLSANKMDWFKPDDDEEENGFNEIKKSQSLISQPLQVLEDEDPDEKF